MNIEVLLAHIRKQKIIRWITINLIIAIAYILTIHLSHEFTNLPGRVASIWLPAGIVLPAVMLFGKRIMAGLICGSIIGLIPFVIALNPPLSILNQINKVDLCVISFIILKFLQIRLFKF